ncbi:hypothetical protein ANCCAN_08571 [Ancylostoma caninum]|uniref:Uncharacterized protein n=1 Tax=Ancylostoma caninum TaxID=29170 RepID=A0A368GM19_ANCCA|nr:hypothetical protein ANCCAN_08571 [Ancylostoma caninum]
MEEVFWELLLALNTTAYHVLKLDERHCELLIELVDILVELTRRQQLGVLSDEQAAEVDAICTYAKLGHLFRDDGAARHHVENVVQTNFSRSLDERSTLWCADSLGVRDESPSARDFPHAMNCDLSSLPGCKCENSGLDQLEGNRHNKIVD